MFEGVVVVVKIGDGEESRFYEVVSIRFQSKRANLMGASFVIMALAALGFRASIYSIAAKQSFTVIYCNNLYAHLRKVL